MLFSGVAVFRGLDYASTRNFQARGRTEVLIPDDVANNSAGFAGLEAAATMTSVGISYLFHRTRHHKMERWLSIGHIGVTGFGVAWNYSLESNHPQGFIANTKGRLYQPAIGDFPGVAPISGAGSFRIQRSHK
jgi:hypothetical protein